MANHQDAVDFESLPDTAPFHAHLLAGALAGIAEHTVMFPVDALKTRMQVQGIMSGSGAAVCLHDGPTLLPSMQSTMTSSLRGLWRGIGTMVVGAGPSHALYFSTYEYAKSVLASVASKKGWAGAEGGEHPHWVNAASGACATMTSDAFLNPFDVIKQRMQVAGSVFRSSFQCLGSVLRQEGISALYVSYPTTLMMSIPYQSIQFTMYEHVRSVLVKRAGTTEYAPMTHVIAGGVAGGTAAAITTPLDAIKTVLQTRGVSSDPAWRSASGVGEACGVIWKRSGIVGFWRGMLPRVVTHAPSTAICWSVYEYFKYVLREERSVVEVKRLSSMEDTEAGEGLRRLKDAM